MQTQVPTQNSSPQPSPRRDETESNMDVDCTQAAQNEFVDLMKQRTKCFVCKNVIVEAVKTCCDKSCCAYCYTMHCNSQNCVNCTFGNGHSKNDSFMREVVETLTRVDKNVRNKHEKRTELLNGHKIDQIQKTRRFFVDRPRFMYAVNARGPWKSQLKREFYNALIKYGKIRECRELLYRHVGIDELAITSTHDLKTLRCMLDNITNNQCVISEKQDEQRVIQQYKSTLLGIYNGECI